MKHIFLVFAMAGGGATVLACSGGQPAAREAALGEDRAAQPRFYSDLGPSTVDVSAYPEELRENYALFVDVCGACHSTARPLNSPYTSEAEWRQYVRRMRGKMKGRGIRLFGDAEERLVAFLVYDSEVRKIRAREAFEAEQARLRTLGAVARE
jgi:hypothetical protein